METKSQISKKFIELFELFEKNIENSTKLDKKSFFGFAKYYLKHYPEAQENNTHHDPAKNLERKLKRWKERLYSTSFQEKTYEELQKYHKALNETYFYQELLEDEYPKFWFDD